MSANRWTVEGLVQVLSELVTERGDVSCRVFCREVGVSVGVIERVCGSWGALRERCGLSPKKAVPRRVTAAVIRAALREAVAALGEGVTLQEFERRSGFSRGVIYARFESWNELRELEGLSRNPKRLKRVAFRELMDELVRLRDELGRIPKSREIAKRAKYGLSTYYNRVGGMKVIRVLLTPHLFQRAVSRRLANGTLTHEELQQAIEERRAAGRPIRR